mgnify:CR=1 FL=1
MWTAIPWTSRNVLSSTRTSKLPGPVCMKEKDPFLSVSPWIVTATLALPPVTLTRPVSKTGKKPGWGRTVRLFSLIFRFSEIGP